MAVATIGAFVVAIWTRSGDYVEGIAVMLFYQIGEFFQSYAVGKSRKNISALMDIRPDYANIEEDGRLMQVDPDEVSVGSIIVVQPGEKVPLDGIVVSGNASLNTSALTGESLPRDVKEGDEIISGCINMNGVLKIQTTKEFGESTVSKILDLVENASSRKSRSEDFISRFAKVYTPAVCLAALALAIVVPVLRMAMGMNANWIDWIYRALTFLVVSCPCALVISVPLSFFAGIGGASKEGVLIKGSNYLEALSQSKYVVFDKTGTLTQGVFEVTGVHHNVLEEAKLLEYAALAECASSHPISKSLQKAYGKEIDRSRVSDIEEISGHGIVAKVDGNTVAAGNGKLMKKLNVPYQDCHSIGTIIHVAINEEYAGHIVISDVVKPHSKEAIAALKKAGVEKTIMLTGDAKRVADQVAAELGVDEVHSELLPGDKVAEVEKLIAGKKAKSKLAFVGDGINDAPVLTRADIGIATFLRLYYNLKHYGEPILAQMLTSLQTIRSRRMLWSLDVIELNKQISELSSQNQMLTTLKQQGLIDPDIFISQSNELTEQLRATKLKKERLLVADGDSTIAQTQELIDILEAGPDFLDTFDAELFGELVDKIIVDSNEQLRFRLKNGLELTETIERTVR